jgi:Lon protease-like protein
MVDMYDLSLFPLNTVLFPGMPLSLHIFEERYKMMIGLCLEKRQPFGVVLIKKGFEALGPLAEPHLVGCTARITQVERLDQGRMNIGAIGRRRFRILTIQRDLPYLVGKVANYPLSSAEPGTESAARRLRPWVVRYMDELAGVESLDFDPIQLPGEPVSLAYLAAMMLRIPENEKQKLLTAVSAVQLLTEMRVLYRREVSFLRMMFEQRVPDQGYFSLN